MGQVGKLLEEVLEMRSRGRLGLHIHIDAGERLTVGVLLGEDTIATGSGEQLDAAANVCRAKLVRWRGMQPEERVDAVALVTSVLSPLTAVVAAMLVVLTLSGCAARVSDSTSVDPGSAPSGTCVLPRSGPIDCSAGFSVDDGRSAQVWQPCSDFGAAACPVGDGCRLGDEVGECSTRPGDAP